MDDTPSSRAKISAFLVQLHVIPGHRVNWGLPDNCGPRTLFQQSTTGSIHLVRKWLSQSGDGCDFAECVSYANSSLELNCAVHSVRFLHNATMKRTCSLCLCLTWKELCPTVSLKTVLERKNNEADCQLYVRRILTMTFAENWVLRKEKWDVS